MNGGAIVLDEGDGRNGGRSVRGVWDDDAFPAALHTYAPAGAERTGQAGNGKAVIT